VIFLLLGVAMGLFAIVLLLFGFASTGLTRETVCDGTKCIRGGVSCAVVVRCNFVLFPVKIADYILLTCKILDAFHHWCILVMWSTSS